MTKRSSEYDECKHFWCPMLGQPMTFGYCRKMQDGLPCHRVLICFTSHFPVESFLKENFTQEEIDKFLTPAKGRVEKIVSVLEEKRDH